MTARRGPPAALVVCVGASLLRVVGAAAGGGRLSRAVADWDPRRRANIRVRASDSVLTCCHLAPQLPSRVAPRLCNDVPRAFTTCTVCTVRLRLGFCSCISALRRRSLGCAALPGSKPPRRCVRQGDDGQGLRTGARGLERTPGLSAERLPLAVGSNDNRLGSVSFVLCLSHPLPSLPVQLAASCRQHEPRAPRSASCARPGAPDSPVTPPAVGPCRRELEARPCRQCAPFPSTKPPSECR